MKNPLLGSSAVFKTSLINSLNNPPPSIPASSKPTLLINLILTLCLKSDSAKKLIKKNVRKTKLSFPNMRINLGIRNH